jgi:hypothetical protein
MEFLVNPNCWRDNIDIDEIKLGISKLDRWIEEQQYTGWDPYDALNSPILKKLSLNNRRIGQLWIQFMKRNPINVRPLIKVPKGVNPKGMGLLLSSYTKPKKNNLNLTKIFYFADWLKNNSCIGYSGSCWGYNFDWPNRGFFAPSNTPNIVNTSFIGHAFLDLERAVSMHDNPDANRVKGKGLKTARSACDFIINDLNRFHEKEDKFCFSYTPIDYRYIHNANLLGAALLADIFSYTAEDRLYQLASSSARFSVGNQNRDGSWTYGISPKDAFIDNFHTGYVLVCLLRIKASLNINEFDNAIIKGYHFWKDNFFLTDGTPKYYVNNLFPIDIHCVAQGIITYLMFKDIDCEALYKATQLTKWGIKNFQDETGYFYYQINRHWINKIPYMRWSQAWMRLALVELLVALQMLADK